MLAELTAGRVEELDWIGFAKEYKLTLMGDWYDQAKGVAELIEGRLALEVSRGNNTSKKRSLNKLIEMAQELEPQLRAMDVRAQFESELALIRSIVIE